MLIFRVSSFETPRFARLPEDEGGESVMTSWSATLDEATPAA
jgi:hypothetical protein